MPSSSRAALKRARQSPRPNPRPSLAAAADVGALPEWNLADLYPALDAPEVKRDLEKSDAECLAFERDFKGQLAALAAGSDAGRALARGGQALRAHR